MLQLLAIESGAILQVALTIGFVAVFALVAVYAERKISAFIQDRLGPMEVGPYGLLQTLADVIKLVLKEPIIPSTADKVLFVLAPALIFISVFAGFAALPLVPGFGGSHVEVGLLYVLGIVAIDVVGLLMAGWGSNNKYALLGSLRAVAQIVSYEIPAALALIASVMMLGTLNLSEMSLEQGIFSEGPIYLLGKWDVSGVGGILGWTIFRYPHLLIAYLVYFVASLAECNRAPFDIPEAESELVAGYHVEYGGFRFALFMLSEYAKMFLVGVIAAVVFLGGWNTIFPNITVGSFELPLADWTSGQPGTWVGALWGSFWLMLKALFAVFVHMWLRWTFPRVRVDQLMTLCWKWLTPIAFGLFVISGIWKLMEVYATL
ncbi:NADH-quinone oxidoreductase subunit NuoH [Pontibacter sp. G13]|uniref:NADH-quinone oxidoreductase subunit NuoH n=1 Tax=Pontibacter sp. G13 TaxID=3074898 RepID=UPI00288BD4B6|nr:NADH-quinone oxidoreductase subunit NuoH [Pontibacter sp. G13]WNJ21202.1 NADH-quinone oxidoreductase subunit NuoH [Pontibacter sp. G13]